MEHFSRHLSSHLWKSSGRRGFGLALILAVAILLGGGAFAGSADAETTPADGQEYSAYSDPEKPALSFVLSDEENVAELKDRFSLGDAEVKSVLALVREENEKLSRAQGESRRLVESNKDRTTEEIRGKVRASGYDAKVREAVAETKAGVEGLLPAGRREEFRTWVDEEWREASREAKAGTATDAYRRASGTTFRIFTTQYEGYTAYEAALPFVKLKALGGYEVDVSLKGREARVPVKEVGPWNEHDKWWAESRKRWPGLERGLPEAEAAFYDNYNRGRDEFGRKVLNPAGIDLTPKAAAKLGLKKYENAWIEVSTPR